MADLITSAVTAQIARSANDIIRACVNAGAGVIAREGISPSILGYLAASTAELLPSSHLIDGLGLSHAFEGTWTSRFMANFMGVQQATTQQALLSENMGKKLVVYATALAAAATKNTVRGILREHLAIALQLGTVAEVPENIYHVCVHSPTLRLIQEDVTSNFERCIIAFDQTETGNSKEASYTELVAIAIAFAAAQRSGAKCWVRIKNLIGAESLCAALGVAFLADVRIGSIHAIAAPAHHASTASTRKHRMSTDTFGGVATSNQYEVQRGNHNESRLSTTTPISIQFEYDDSGVVSIGICEPGGPVRDFIVPEGRKGRPSRNTMPAGEILAIAKNELNRDLPLPWRCKAALGAFQLRGIAKEIVEVLDNCRDGDSKSMTANIVYKWMEEFVRETGGGKKEMMQCDKEMSDKEMMQRDMKRMQQLLTTASLPDIKPLRFQRDFEILAGSDDAGLISVALTSTCQPIERMLFLCLLKSLFGLSYKALEVNLNLLTLQTFPPEINLVIEGLINVLPAFSVPVTTYRRFSSFCSVVQCGGYVLMPRILAEEKIGDVDSSLFIMVPGRLAKDGVPVNGFFYDEQHTMSHIDALRPDTPIPSNAGDSDAIDYVYEEADYGYKFWTVEAGHRLDLDGLIQGILWSHSVDDSYGERGSPMQWQCAAPHHTMLATHPKTIYLAYGNVAGKRLALSRAGTGCCISVVHTGRDYKRALAYANQHKCGVVIL
ncbi:hypothetical protein BT69DRAFT_1284923 [Atractiella rhizophila]|nr:hypothetical protein BT69DRAFT_1284923 [Atractiella rhizophila]